MVLGQGLTAVRVVLRVVIAIRDGLSADRTPLEATFATNKLFVMQNHVLPLRTLGTLDRWLGHRVNLVRELCDLSAHSTSQVPTVEHQMCLDTLSAEDVLTHRECVRGQRVTHGLLVA